MRPDGGASGGIVFVLSGPSGVGKDSALEKLQVLESNLHYCVTATTRSPRPGERDGVDYFFLSQDEFLRLRESGGLIEWAQVHGRYYGVPAAQVQVALEQSQDVLACIDVQGAMTFKRRIPSAVLIFLAPSSAEELRRRLSGRGTENDAELELRLANADQELVRVPDFDYVVVNRDGGLDAAVDAVRSIIQAERLRVNPRYASFGAANG